MVFGAGAVLSTPLRGIAHVQNIIEAGVLGRRVGRVRPRQFDQLAFGRHGLDLLSFNDPGLLRPVFPWPGGSLMFLHSLPVRKNRPPLVLDTVALVGLGTSDRDAEGAQLLRVRIILCGLLLLCLLLGVTTFHFYSRYLHETAAARQKEAYLLSQVHSLRAENQTLQVQQQDLSSTLEQTKTALVLALKPSVSTHLPIPK